MYKYNFAVGTAGVNVVREHRKWDFDLWSLCWYPLLEHTYFLALHGTCTIHVGTLHILIWSLLCIRYSVCKMLSYAFWWMVLHLFGEVDAIWVHNKLDSLKRRTRNILGCRYKVSDDAVNVTIWCSFFHPCPPHEPVSRCYWEKNFTTQLSEVWYVLMIAVRK